MTKAIRVENADTSAYQVIVQTWDKGTNGNADVLVSEQFLPAPASMSHGLYIHSGRYLIVKEVE